ncbi:toll/interleukin-1 receptor domain-containing protein [Roseateles cellulosilyticus]|uniref:Toll/interleukin-1 receptor domain-containing protein n=1 Tax=Pelomonas cellulosilytica TaxID=2906762 RepID=A0ABS8XVK2_9BURK|nr:toll/interleukin-1 receptor domain-containing protein [Pelomonas sp. P8]MCE4554661.1 toll/interleukin-1 receptor domain-containing protein [Pelomonas sp. P8]
MRRVFISHRNGRADEIAFIRRLRDGLADDGFETLVDFERLASGAALRQDVYTWLGICHAAVVLLSPEALGEDSAWVPTESSILAWRRTLDPKFLLIPVLMPGVELDDLRVHLRFRDLGLHDLLCIPFENEASTLGKIRAALQPLQPIARTPMEELAEQIEVKLQGVRDDFLDEVTRLCGAAQHELPAGMLRNRVAALALLQAPLAETLAALEYLAPRLGGAHDIDHILDLVAPSWVDLCAARWLAQCALAPAPRPAVVVNAQTQFGAEMFVRRACCRPPRTMWHLVKVTAVFGEKAFEDLAMEIQVALETAFASALQYADSPAQQLLLVLAKLHKLGRATVVMLRLNVGFEELIPPLQERFPYLTFLFLSGDELPSQEFPTSLLRLVEPSLAPGQELDALTTYQTARALLRPTSPP